jgi:hypothetical protein
MKGDIDTMTDTEKVAKLLAAMVTFEGDTVLIHPKADERLARAFDEVRTEERYNAYTRVKAFAVRYAGMSGFNQDTLAAIDAVGDDILDGTNEGADITAGCPDATL